MGYGPHVLARDEIMKSVWQEKRGIHQPLWNELKILDNEGH